MLFQVLVIANIIAIRAEKDRRLVKISPALHFNGIEIKPVVKNNHMLSIIPDLPLHVVGVKATGEVTTQDFNAVVMPAVDSLASSADKINYLLYLDTDLGNFTAGAWAKDAILGLKHLFKWNKVAVVSDNRAVEKFTDIFSYAVPGEYRGFPTAEYEEAVKWVSS
jgi:hypothetical protein